MRKYLALAAVMVIVPVVGIAVAAASGGEDEFRARLFGYQEVPAISTRGHGSLELDITSGGIQYRLEYSEVSSDVLFAHIHFGRWATNGGVSAFLCGGGGTPACPARSGVVRGTIAASDVVGPIEQGIDEGELRELLRAMFARATYANVHTELFPTGEIRGQIARN
jgi:CHRD domain